MREAIRASAEDPRTGKIDMGLLNTEVLNMLDAGGTKGKSMKWSDVMKKILGKQSSVKVDPVQFSEVIKGLENEGVVKVAGEKDKRKIRRIGG